jgi:hypothetical protein
MTAHCDLVLQAEPSQKFAAEKFAPPLRNNSVHVLTLTPFYPKQDDEGSGCFIAEPLQALIGEGVENTVLVASPFYRGRQQVNAGAAPG